MRHGGVRAFSKDLAEALRQGYARPGYQGAMQIWFEKLQQKKSAGHPIIGHCHQAARPPSKSDVMIVCVS
ncbi:MAG TPA: hypothetical protein DCK93_13260 [Blastocatellia bacterium]|jgi:hypothetical protein|nr:hypothetical protein [Blastocatellia bacterium]